LKLKLAVLAVLVVLASGCLKSDNNGSSDSTTDITLLKGDFEVVSGFENTHTRGEVKAMEFFDFYCPHCYQLHIQESRLERKYGDALKMTSMPFPLRPASFPPLEAYVIARDMGKGEEMKDAIFRAKWEEGLDIGNKEVLVELAGRVGLDTDEFKSRLEKGARREVQNSRTLGGRYGISATPTVILDNNIRVTGADVDNLETVITSILAQDVE